MASSPSWKIYTPDAIYEASAKHAEVAAAIVAVLGEGATIRYNHNVVVWTEGQEGKSAADSYDDAADIMASRVKAHYEQQRRKN